MITRFFKKQRFFSTQSQCCLTFSLIELQLLLRCCLMHISIIILRRFLYLLCLCPSLDLQSFPQYFETCDVLPNFPFTTSETMRDYYL